jgi:hypothetical protein
MNQCPTAIGLSLCEQVIIEDKTHNVTLVNCFTERTAEKFPSEPIPFVAFANLTDGLGEGMLEIVVQRLDTLDVVCRKSMRVRFTSPGNTMRLTVRIRDCCFPIPGHYQVSVLADGEFVAQRKMAVWEKEDDS